MQTSYDLDQILKVASINTGVSYAELKSRIYDLILQADKDNLRYPVLPKFTNSLQKKYA